MIMIGRDFINIARKAMLDNAMSVKIQRTKMRSRGRFSDNAETYSFGAPIFMFETTTKNMG